MPFGDRTGPMGFGPGTGRGAGYCAGYGVPGYMNPIPGRLGLGRGWAARGPYFGIPGAWPRLGRWARWGRGRGFGLGRGRGFGRRRAWGFYGPPTPYYW